jgi:hypothetical protein
MAAARKEAQGKVSEKSGTDRASTSRSVSRKIDPTAPAGSPNSLGEESVRDGRPNTDDSIVEAIDEEGPGTNPLTTGE